MTAKSTRSLDSSYVLVLPVLWPRASRAPPALAQEGPLGVARDLYASARYDEALAMLNGVRQRRARTDDLDRSSSTGRSACWRSDAAPRPKRRSPRS